MAELGSTTDPKQLIEGEPAEIRASARNLARFGTWFLDIGNGFKRLDAGGWQGEAGDGFRQRYEREPLRWLKAGDAFQDAAKTMGDYSEVLEWGHAQAREAIESYEAGQRTTERAQAEHQRAPAGTPFDDPGEPQREHARDMLRRARRQVEVTGDRAASAMHTAEQEAPEKPTFLDDVGAALGDVVETVGDIPGNIAHYALDGVGNAADAAGTTVAGAVDGAGNVLGGALDLAGFDEAGESVQRTTEARSDVLFAKTNRLAGDIREGADDVASALGAEDPPAYGLEVADPSPQPVIVKSEKYPESAGHIMEAQAGVISRGDRQQPGDPMPSDLTIDKENADINRREALRGIPTRGGQFLDRDEYPPAMFAEGGDGSSVKYIPAGDNRGSGASMNAQIRAQDLGRDDHVRIFVE